MPDTQSRSSLFIGLMSGTSLDGVDGTLASFVADQPSRTLASAYVPFPHELRAALMALQTAGTDEINREALAANALARCYADCVTQLLRQATLRPEAIRATGVHGQTIRHRPELGYTRQTNNPALLAELIGIDVIADFRSRDIAAGGQGAPLVPAFHQAIFGNSGGTRVVANIGGIGNISILQKSGEEERVTGFDTGPGNVLMDAWTAQHLGKPYDAGGMWAAGGKPIPALLESLRDEAFFRLPPPKSTGRDLFHSAWLNAKLAAFPPLQAVDVQATLAALTATTLADAIATHAPDAAGIYVCGGGGYNEYLMLQLQQALAARNCAADVQTIDVLGIAANQVEALAFAWLAYCHVEQRPGNLPAVTGARGLRILGALYPK